MQALHRRALCPASGSTCNMLHLGCASGRPASWQMSASSGAKGVHGRASPDIAMTEGPLPPLTQSVPAQAAARLRWRSRAGHASTRPLRPWRASTLGAGRPPRRSPASRLARPPLVSGRMRSLGRCCLSMLRRPAPAVMPAALLLPASMPPICCISGTSGCKAPDFVHSVDLGQAAAPGPWSP